VIAGRDDLLVAHDGSEGLSPQGWLPDRVSIGVLTRTFPPELVDRIVAQTDTRELRRRLLPARLVVYFVLALWLFRGPNCGYGRVMAKLVDALYHRRRGRQLLDGVLDPHGWIDTDTDTGAGAGAGAGRRWRPPNISSLARARTRLGADPLHMLFDAVAGPVAGPAPDGAEDGAEGVFCCGLRVVSMDGTTTDVPNSAANYDYFGGPATAARTGAFPQVRWVVAAESGTGALIGATLGPHTTGEQPLARDLLAAFDNTMLVLADRNFLSHTLARDTLAAKTHILWRASATFRLTPTRILADGTYLAKLYPRRKPDGPPITVRVIEYTVHTTGPDAVEEPSEVFALVTDLFDVETYPALDLASAYSMRWQAETVIDHHKTDMGHGMAVLRSHDPEGVAQEMWALFAVYQAIHTLIGTAVDAVGVPPAQISFPHALAAAADSVTAGFPPSPPPPRHSHRH
jgi:Insertion element 4 transposase N-terminal/Transposase DDE domain